MPANDTISGATPVTLGFSEVLDTTDATTDAQDDQLNETCGAPATDASVWYVLEGTGTGVVVDVSSSDYSAGVLVGEGSPGSLETVVCGPGAVGLTTEVGTTYYVLAIDDQSDGAGNGGSLSISFNEAPSAPTVKITVRPTGTFDPQTGTAHLRGTYTCTDADFTTSSVRSRSRWDDSRSRDSSASWSRVRATASVSGGRPRCSPRTASSRVARR